MQSLSFSQWLFLEENIRDQNRFQDINDRVKYGKDMEYKIVQTLRSKGWEIVEPSNKQDKSDKIDGTLMRSSDPIPVTLPAPIQVKYRDTGDDILMEVVREFDYDYTRPAESLLTGRDMIGKAKIYVSLNRDGNVIRIRSADEAKSIAIELLRGLLGEKARAHKNNHGQIKIVSDPRDGRIKINAFINPDSFAWKKDYLVDNLWDATPTIAQSPAQILPRDVPPSIIPHIATALETGSATFKLPHSAKKTKAIAAYVAKRGLSISVDGDNASLKKIA